MMRFPFALRSTVDDLQDELAAKTAVSISRNAQLHAEIVYLSSALRKIADGQTDGANATVKRLCKIARDALAGAVLP